MRNRAHDVALVALAVLAAVLAAAPPLAAQSSTATVERPTVAIVGASVSGGFVSPVPRPDGTRDRTVRLRQVLRGVWDEDAVAVKDRSDVMTFVDPVRLQGRKVKLALRDQPDLVVAIDFMFWFGYGYVRGPSNDAKAAARLQLQQQGLDLLGQLECPIVVGDYPDMHGADPRMLAPAQIPSVDTLRELNDRLRAWADRRGNVQVFPLAGWVAEMKEKATTIELSGRTLEVPAGYVLQGDRLHATRLGMALIGRRIAEAVDGLVPPGDPLRRPDLTLDAMVEAADASPEVEGLAPAGAKEPAKEPAAAGSAKGGKSG